MRVSRTTKRLVAASTFLGLCLLAAGPARAGGAEQSAALRAGLVRLHVTTQFYDATSPWKVSGESTRGGRGVLIKPGVILTSSSNVQYQRMIEFSVANSARRYPAKLRHVDHRLGLALIDITDEEQKAALKPLPLGDPITLDAEVEIHQLGRDNMLEHFTGRVVRANAWSTNMTLTIKTNCSDRGDGQVVLVDGKIVGLVTSTWSSRQEGTVFSLESIRHYLDDFADDAYNGVPGPGPWTQALLRADLRTYYGLADDQHGLAITRVPASRTGAGVLQVDDVLLSIDGHDIDDEGKFVHPTHGRLNAGYLLQGRRYVGDRISATVLRDGKVVDVELELKGQSKGEKRIPDDIEDRPQYVVTAGLVILELTSRSPIGRSSGGVLLRRYRDREGWDEPSERKRVIYVDRVMQDPVNKGFEGLQHAPIKTINGKPIGMLGDVLEALKTPDGDFHVFRFEGVTADYVVPASELETVDKRVLDTYKVPVQQFIKGAE
jgi:S1-C subfamily serine protease